MTDTPLPLDLEWDQTITRTYQEVVAEADPDAGTSRSEAFTIATARIAEMIRTGELFVDTERAIRSTLMQVDSRQGATADRMIGKLIAGQGDLGLDVEAIMNTVVTLGEGRRKLLRHIDTFDIQEMDRLRYRNLRAQQEAYARWRDLFDVAQPAISRFGTLGQAHARGAFTEPEAVAS